MRASNSSARLPSKIMCVCESTQPGSTARPPRSIFFSTAAERSCGRSFKAPTQVMTPLPSASSAPSLMVPASETVRSSLMLWKSVLMMPFEW